MKSVPLSLFLRLFVAVLICANPRYPRSLFVLPIWTLGFWHCFGFRASYFEFLLIYVFCFPCTPSTLVETPLQIVMFFAKQSQFQNGQYKHKYSKNKGLCQRTTNNEQRTSFKTNPIKANSPARYAIRDTDPVTQRDTQYEIRHPTYEIRDTNPIPPRPKVAAGTNPASWQS